MSFRYIWRPPPLKKKKEFWNSFTTVLFSFSVINYLFYLSSSSSSTCSFPLSTRLCLSELQHLQHWPQLSFPLTGSRGASSGSPLNLKHAAITFMLAFQSRKLMEMFRRDRKLTKCHGRSSKNSSCRYEWCLAHQEHWEKQCWGIFTSPRPVLLNLPTEGKVTAWYF